MRKLKLQMQLTINGFSCGPNGELDWMTWNWDDKLKTFVDELHKTVDTILLGRKMTDGFVSYWTDVVKNKPESEEYPFAKKMVDYPKVVFTKTLEKSEWENTVLAKGDVVEEVNKIKESKGKELPIGQAGIIVYGGATFVSSLIKNNLIDEYYLFINPQAINNGMDVFGEVDGILKLQLVESKAFECGIVVNKYIPIKKD